MDLFFVFFQFNVAGIQMINKLFRVPCPGANKDAEVLLPFIVTETILSFNSHGDTRIQISRVYYFYKVFRKETFVFFNPGLASSVGSLVDGKGDS